MVARPRTRKVVQPLFGGLPLGNLFTGQAFELFHLYLAPDPFNPCGVDVRMLVFIFLHATTPHLPPFGRIWADICFKGKFAKPLLRPLLVLRWVFEKPSILPGSWDPSTVFVRHSRLRWGNYGIALPTRRGWL